MKTLITSEGNTINSRFDLRFGRAGWFCLLNEASGQTIFIENEFRENQQGAGTRVAEKVASLGVEKIISGDFGPKAKELLDTLKIQMVVLQEKDITIKKIIQKLKH